MSIARALSIGSNRLTIGRISPFSVRRLLAFAFRSPLYWEMQWATSATSPNAIRSVVLRRISALPFLAECNGPRLRLPR